MSTSVPSRALVLRLTPLLAGSGFCGLLYQAVWSRSLRGIFGASTLASASVMAIFMGGLGFGSLWLSRRADRSPSPLGLYGNHRRRDRGRPRRRLRAAAAVERARRLAPERAAARRLVESTVALGLDDSHSFIVNGKVDGSAFLDAPMQITAGLIGAALHPNPRRALVIGLGTGSTAGWLARVPTMERVDVVELEPTVNHVAEILGPLNRYALT